MRAGTLNVSLSQEHLALIHREVERGHYSSASEVVREALRQWLERRIATEVAELDRRHAGAWERDTTPEEEAAILRIQKKVRAEMFADHNGREPKPRKRPRG
jgi:putative addiction module CopG family antidote